MNYVKEFMKQFNDDIAQIDPKNFEHVMMCIDKTKIKLVKAHIEHITEKKVEWVQEKHVIMCDNCYKEFSVTNRKHHCRCCGNVFCNKCTPYKKPIPLLGYDKPVRHCSKCFYDEVVIYK